MPRGREEGKGAHGFRAPLRRGGEREPCDRRGRYPLLRWMMRVVVAHRGVSDARAAAWLLAEPRVAPRAAAFGRRPGRHGRGHHWSAAAVWSKEWAARNTILLPPAPVILYRSRNAGYPAPPARVGSRTGARTVGGGFPAKLFRLLGGFTVPPWPRFQLPPRQTQRADFPHCAFLLVSCEGLWDLSHWERFRLRPTHPVVVKQPQSVIQPPPTPPLPAKALAIPRTHQMPPHLLFHPIFDKAKASGGVSHGKVAHPAPQNRVDQSRLTRSTGWDS